MRDVTAIFGFSGSTNCKCAYPSMQATQRETASGESEQAIVKRHERLIRSAARPFVSRGVCSDDLEQEGRIALLDAVRRWRADEGAAIWTYARKFVFSAMLKFVTREASEPCRRGEQDETVLDRQPSSECTSEDALAVAEWVSILKEEVAAAGLSDLEKEILQIRFSADGSLRDAAEVLNKPITTVIRTYHRAIGKLRERVGARI